MIIKQPIIDLNALNCDDCPAKPLRNGRYYSPSGNWDWYKWIKYCECLREKQTKEIIKNHGKIKLYILTESIPRERFVYDINSSYRSGQLRYNLCKELLGKSEDCKGILIDFLKKKGILIVDCALCPLYILTSRNYKKYGLSKKYTYKDRRIAATICLNRHTSRYLNINSNAQIITIFPCNCGFHKKKKPEIRIRIIKEFNFNYLDSLKDTIQQILGDC